MASDKQTQAYPLGRSSLAAARLDLQHYMWTQCMGYHLHPSIPVRPGAHIADVGCGTAMWSLTLPTTVKDIHIDAMDISLAQTPPKEWLPPHITTRELDVFADPFPEDLVGKYDIIHVRLFLLVVQQGDPLPVLRNLVRMLKPGGYLQWQEYNVLLKNYVTVGDKPFGELKLGALNKLFDPRGNPNFPSWPATFVDDIAKDETISKEVTLVEHHTVEHTPKHLLPTRQEVNFMGAREYVASMAMSDPERAAALGKLLTEEEEESWTTLRRGAAQDCPSMTWVLQKNSM